MNNSKKTRKKKEIILEFVKDFIEDEDGPQFLINESIEKILFFYIL